MLGRLARPPMVAVLFAILIVGCSRRSPSGMHPVRGTVFVDGQPAHYATVSLTPVDKSDGRLPSGGMVDEDGEFRLTTLKQFDGAEPGDYWVAISWCKPKDPNRSEVEYGPELLPKKYQNPAESGLKELRVTIEEGDNELPPFEISTKK
ncbi:MAG: hypothetical protein WCH39_03695 [Schlesneria sp.]